MPPLPFAKRRAEHCRAGAQAGAGIGLAQSAHRVCAEIQLGITVEPDSPDAVVAGMKQLLSTPPSPRWEEYEAAASWAVNARGVLKAAGFQ